MPGKNILSPAALQRAWIEVESSESLNFTAGKRNCTAYQKTTIQPLPLFNFTA